MTKRKKLLRWLLLVPLILVILTAHFLLQTLNPGAKSVPKTELRAIAVMPFQNLTGDSTYNHWEYSFQDLLINKLASSNELSVRQHETMFDILKTTGYLELTSVTPSVAREIGEILDTRTVIHGSIHKAGQKVRITANLLDPRSDEVYNTYQLTGDIELGFFDMVDSLSNMIKNFLEIKVYQQDLGAEASEIEYTESSEAYNHFVRGTRAFFNVNMESAIESFQRALEIDTSFVLAQHFLAVAYLGEENYEKGEYWLMKADRNREKLPEKIQIYIDRFKAELRKDEPEVISHLKRITDIDPFYRIAWFDLGMTYNTIRQYDQALFALQKALEVNEQYAGGDWEWPYIYTALGTAYHHVGETELAKAVYQEGLRVLPDNPLILFEYGKLHLAGGNDEEAVVLIDKYKRVRSNDESWSQADILGSMGQMYYEAGRYAEADSFYREAMEADPQNLKRINELAWFLIHTERNIEEGISLNNRVLQIDPDDFFFLETRGMGLYHSGQIQQAYEVLTRAWELRPQYRHTHYEYIRKAEAALGEQA